MRNLFALFLAALMMLPQAAQAKKENEGTEVLKVMSYNIRLGSANDGTNSWSLRYVATGEMLDDQAPDVFGVQEALDYQVRYINEMCGYEYVGVGRENGKKEGEHMAIFWNKKSVSMLKWGTFWLSETPQKPSKGWDAACFRTATWALMKDKKTGRKFYFVNTHLAPVRKPKTDLREAQLKCILDYVEKNKLYPAILTGDLNAAPDSAAIKLLEQKWRIAGDNTPTYPASKPNWRIDFIAFAPADAFEVIAYEVGNEPTASDHRPIKAKLRINKPE